MRKQCSGWTIAVIPFLAAGCKDAPTLPQSQPASLPADAADAPEETEPASTLEWPAPPEEPPETGPHGGLLFPLPGERGYVEWQPDRRVLHLLTRERQLLRVTSLRASVAGADGPADVALGPCEEPATESPSCFQYNSFPEGEAGTLLLLLRLDIDNQGIPVKLITPGDSR